MTAYGVCPLNVKKEPSRVHMIVEQPTRCREQIEPSILDAIRSCYLGETPWPLFIWGGVGRGKTCASLLLLDHHVGMYATMSGLCQLVIDAQQGHLEADEVRKLLLGNKPPSSRWNWRRFTVASLWSYIRETKLFVLDELGYRPNVSDHHRETAKLLIDAMASKALVVISNKSLDDIGRMYDAPIASRLGGGTLVQATGPDRRQHGKAANAL